MNAAVLQRALATGRNFRMHQFFRRGQIKIESAPPHATWKGWSDRNRSGNFPYVTRRKTSL